MNSKNHIIIKSNTNNNIINNNSSNNSSNNNNSSISNNSCNKNNTEILFFKVFRNKYLFYQIFSKFEYSSYLNYERLVNCKYILESFSNGKDIIFDKVKIGSYLVPDSLNQVYKVIKENTSENVLFYTQLFNNYPKYYQIPEEIYLFISNSNKLALKLYIRRLNISSEQLTEIIQQYIQDNSNLLATTFNGILMLNYLRDKFKIVINGDIGNRLFRYILIDNFTRLKLEDFIKLVKALLEIYHSRSIDSIDNSFNGSMDDNRDFDSVQHYLVSVFDGDSNNQNYNLESIFDQVKLFNYSKEELSIDFLETLSVLNYCIETPIVIENKEYLNSFNNRLIKFRNSIYKLIFIFYTIINSNNSNNNNNNNSGINNSSDSNNNNNSFTLDQQSRIINNIKSKKIEVYYFFYFYNNLLNTLNNKQCFLRQLKNKNNSSCGNSWSICNSIYVNNNKERINILKEYFRIVYSNNKSGYKDIALPSLIQLDDLELIKVIHQEFRELIEPSFTNSEMLKQVIFSIISPKILDFYYNDKDYKNIFFQDNSVYWQYISFKKTLVHYEKLMRISGYHFLVGDSMVQNIQTEPYCSILSLLSRSLLDLNETVYKLAPDFSLESYSDAFSTVFSNKKSNVAIRILNSFKSKSLNLSKVDINSFKLLHWFINSYYNNNQDNQSEAISMTPITEFLPKLKIVPKFDPKLSTEFTLSSIQYIHSLIFNQRYIEAVKYCMDKPTSVTKYSISTPCLGQFLKEVINFSLDLKDRGSINGGGDSYIHQVVLKDLVSNFLITSATIGDLKIFQDLDFGNLINGNGNETESNMNQPILSKGVLKNLLISALDSNNIEIVDILLKYTTLSFNEFSEIFNNRGDNSTKKNSKLTFKRFINQFK